MPFVPTLQASSQPRSLYEFLHSRATWKSTADSWVSGSSKSTVRRLSSQRHVQVLLCAACSCLNYADRVNMSVAIIAMAAHHGWNHAQQSAVMSAFFFGYLPMQIGGALLCRRFGAKAVLAYGAIVWSAFTALTPVAARLSFSILLACRVGMGLSEGVAFPAIFHYLASWIPKAERSRAVSTFLVGGHIGTTLALVLSPRIIAWHSWQMVLYMFGGAGGVWVFFWVLLARDMHGDPDERITDGRGGVASHNRQAPVSNSPTPLASMSSTPGPLLSNKLQRSRMPIGLGLHVRRYLAGLNFVVTPAERRAVLFILTSTPCLAICCTQFTTSFCHYVILSWLPTYFSKVFNVGTASLWFTFLPYMAMAVSSNFAGWIADHLLSRGMSLTHVRKLVTATAFSGASVFLIIFSVTRTVGFAIGNVTIALSFVSLVTGGFEASYLDVAPPALAGTFKSVGNSLGALSGILAMFYTSFVLHVTHESWRAVFASLALFYCLGMGVFVVFATAERLSFGDIESDAGALTA